MIESGKFHLVLTDVDVVSKLAHWRLLDALPVILGCQMSQIATVPSLLFRANKAKTNPDKVFQDSATATYAHEILQSMGQLPSPDEDAVSILQRYPKIDPGEAVLLAIAYKIETALLVTGDKNAMRSFHDAYQSGQFTNLQGRILCLEQIIACCLTHHGIAHMQECIKPALQMDISIKNIFGSRCDAPAGSVHEGLSSYIEALKSETGDLLHTTA